MADTPNDSSSLANEGSPSAPKITVVSEPDEQPTEEDCMPKESVENKDSGSMQTPSFNFKCSPTASQTGFGLGSSGSPTFNVKPQFSFGSKMSGLKPASPFGSSPLRASFLRPPQLASPDKFGSTPVFGSSNSVSKSSFPLKPPRLLNPFAKAKDDEQQDEAAGSTSQLSKVAVSASEGGNRASPPASLPKFVPLGTPPPSQPRVNPAPPPPAASTAAATGFVFGQNLHERVTEAAGESSSEKKESSETKNGASCSGSMLASNGTTENLFTSVLKRDHGDKNNDSGGESNQERPSKSLSEAAREYEEARAVKRKYEEVAVVTGEEDEVNVLQINCKLFAYDKVKSSWAERGRGNLRLNDKDLGSGHKQSRVIMRATGSLRVVLNTKLWPGMVVEKVSTKSVRLTAMDASGEILVFLVMASPKDADFLYMYLENRVASLKASCADSASSHPDTSRDSSSNEGNSSDSSDGNSVKKLAAESDMPGGFTNHSDGAAGSSAEDTGGRAAMDVAESADESESSSSATAST